MQNACSCSLVVLIQLVRLSIVVQRWSIDLSVNQICSSMVVISFFYFLVSDGDTLRDSAVCLIILPHRPDNDMIDVVLRVKSGL